jgi:hypothetical protein
MFSQERSRKYKKREIFPVRSPLTLGPYLRKSENQTLLSLLSYYFKPNRPTMSSKKPPNPQPVSYGRAAPPPPVGPQYIAKACFSPPKCGFLESRPTIPAYGQKWIFLTTTRKRGLNRRRKLLKEPGRNYFPVRHVAKLSKRFNNRFAWRKYQ